jgi:hypothetical protein
VRRANLRSVKEHVITPIPSDSHGLQGILCKQNATPREIFDITSKTLRYPDCSTPITMGKDNTGKRQDKPASPISNYPRQIEYDGGMPDAVTLEIFSLRRQNAELWAKLQGANNKLTKALELMYSFRRFLQLWVFEGQGESYDQVHDRIKSLQSTIDHIECQTNFPSPPLEIPARWRKNETR